MFIKIMLMEPMLGCLTKILVKVASTSTRYVCVSCDGDDVNLTPSHKSIM